MPLADYFEADYRAARARFLEACRARNIVATSFVHPQSGPNGETLATDVAVLDGTDSAGGAGVQDRRVLLANCATHGAEGPSGSAALSAWLDSLDPDELPGNVRVVLVHAINPYGFAWIRRVTEDNVDLNRNFIAFDGHPPRNDAYDELHERLVPDHWSAQTGSTVLRSLNEYAEQHGLFALQSALSRGQYNHADGIFYGGTGPSWPNATFRAIVDRWVRGAPHVAFIDFHTGLGPYGHGELITKRGYDTDEVRRLLAWYGPAVKSSVSGDSNSPELSGIITTALRDVMPDDGVTSITAEFGTYPVQEVIGALLADNWLHARGDPASPLGADIKRRLSETFAPADRDWRELVVLRSLQLIRRGIAGLNQA